MSPRGFVSFVGAGPGDPELITVKGLRRLRAAEVVIHDRLVPMDLLDETADDIEVIDVGKAPGRHCLGQGEIDRLIVDRAERGRRVVRLKGGDPGLFARLAEELHAVREAGVPYEVIPGVTAATAAAAATGIPLTERGRASLVVFATGTDHAGAHAGALDWSRLAPLRGTLVFYMAVHGLAAIVATLIEHGRDGGEPAVIVSVAGTARERIVVAALRDIVGAARRAEIEAPALLLTGPTVESAIASGASRIAISMAR